MSSSATTSAGVPYSRAIAIRSQPPSSTCPSSRTRLPSGHTCESCCVVAIGGASCHAVRTVRPQPPDRSGVRDGLAYDVFLPPRGDAAAGVVVVHGADSSRLSHADFARRCAAAGIAAVAYDQRGHGDSEGALDGRAIDDVAAMAALLPAGVPLALRGSSMGGYLALVAGAALGAAAVVAVCPASAEGLARGLRQGRFSFPAGAGGGAGPPGAPPP